MITTSNLCELIEKGNVYHDVKGDSPEEIYKEICSMAKMPEGLSSDKLYTELSEREKILSTAVGNGIAIPHPRSPIISSRENSRIIVCFPSSELNMSAPDARLVYCMFILLSNSTTDHIQTLAALAKLFRNKDFLNKLQKRPSRDELLAAIRQSLN